MTFTIENWLCDLLSRSQCLSILIKGCFESYHSIIGVSACWIRINQHFKQNVTAISERMLFSRVYDSF